MAGDDDNVSKGHVKLLTTNRTHKNRAKANRGQKAKAKAKRRAKK